MPQTVDILGVKVCAEELENLINYVIKSTRRTNKRIVIACANPHSVRIAKELNEFMSALNSFDVVLPDGVGVLFAAKFLGYDIKKRISGPDFFEVLTTRLNQIGGFSYFFVGSTDEVLNRIVERMSKDFPNIRVSGTYAPPYTEGLYLPEAESLKIIDLVNTANPDFLWVGMTAPKQELWIYKYIDKLVNVKVIGAIGAAFNFFSGTKKRSPKIFRDLGLEWLLRFINEPKRLWKRTFVSAPVFLYYVLMEKLRR
ncbi:MAG: WecB/TagA/CpsF family glycosyltransferase [Nitrososphaeria archaeon]